MKKALLIYFVLLFSCFCRAQVSAEKLREIWTTINIQAGKFRDHYDTRTETVPSYDIVYLVCHFANADLDIKLVFDKDMKIAGFFFTPSRSKEEYRTPSYDDPANYIMEDIEIITGDYHLPGEEVYLKFSYSEK